jgi:predicted enzyme related to lactoylglutathione lyase
MNRPVHFEIPADDLVRAKKFYEEVFGWKFKKWGENSGNMEYWLIETGPKEEMGINGGLMKRVKPVSGEGAAGYFCTMDIKDLEEIVEKVKKAGGKIASDRMDIPKVGSMYYCTDTEMNKFGILQPDMEAMKEMDQT